MKHLEQWETFINNQLPTRHDERWKYADLSFLKNTQYQVEGKPEGAEWKAKIEALRLQGGDSILLVVINGHFIPELSDLAKLPATVTVSGLDQEKMLDVSTYPFAALNASGNTQAVVLTVANNVVLSLPIHLLSLSVGEHAFIAQPYYVFVLGKHSQVNLIEQYENINQQPYLLNILTHIQLEQEAKLDYCKIQHEGANAAHFASTFITQKQNSTVSLVNVTKGAKFSRDELIVNLQEPGADCRTSGFYRLSNNNQFVDHHIEINHQAAHSQSEMLYKGILDNKSRAVFNGRLHVAPDAQKILAHQENHNLLLSHEAEVYSKPELEIYADDVKCKHGATIGQIDQEALFYLRSRGIPQAEAMAIILQGFSDDILQRVTHPIMQKRLQESI